MSPRAWAVRSLCAGALALAQASAALPAQLSIGAGVVVKFGPQAGLQVHDSLSVDPSVVFTSRNDSSVGGAAVLSAAGSPAAGDWLGLLLDPSVSVEAIPVNGFTLRYAGALGAAALSLGGQAYQLSNYRISNSVVGVLASAPGSTPALSGFQLQGNGVGLLATQGATPSLTQSVITGNTQFGVQNLQPSSTVVARSNWWGSPSGPKDPVGHPSGQGDAVSAGVDYGQALSAAPLVGCSLSPTQGYTTQQTQVVLQLSCQGATQFRLGAQANLSAVSYTAMPASGLVSYTLAATSGPQQVYAQFQSAGGLSVTVSMAQPLRYLPPGPSIQFSSPSNGDTVTANTALVATATAPAGVASVQFLVDQQPIATLNAAPWQTPWNVQTFANGAHTLTAIVTDAFQQTAQSQIGVTLQKAALAGPVIGLQFNGSPLASGSTLTSTGTLQVSAQSPQGVQGVSVTLDGNSVASFNGAGAASVNYSVVLGFAGLANGSHTLVVNAADPLGNSSQSSVAFTLALSAPAVPTITVPASGYTTTQSLLTVSGSAAVGSWVQLYLNGTATGNPMSVGANGGFSSVLSLPSPGQYSIQASAANAHGSSAKSAAVSVAYQAPLPSISFVSPSSGATLSGTSTIQLAASAASGIAQVNLTLDGAPLAKLTQAPYTINWDTTQVSAGAHQLGAQAIAQSGTQASATLGVSVLNTPPKPAAPPLSYAATVSSISPAVSYGDQPIVITGSAVATSGGGAVPNAPLLLILNNGVTRTITITSDPAGAFSYRFLPQSGDSGTYQVSVINPAATASASQGQFSINRLSFSLGQYNLQAARGVSSQIAVTARASVGTGTSGLMWVARPQDQPSGALPTGVQINGGAGLSLAGGASAPMLISFLADNTAPSSGTVILSALANETGSTVRATLVINFQLHAAAPALMVSPTSVQTGVQQGQSVNASVTLSNQGVANATGVQAVLLDQQGKPPPSWVFLASAGNIGTLAVGAQTPLQVTANPGRTVADGVYHYNLTVSAANDAGGTVPVSVAVTQAGQGTVTFQVVDLYTGTLDAQGQPIPGLAGASIWVQNQAVTSIQQTLTSDSQGQATVSNLPPGTYSYRVTAANHSTVTGQVLILPGVTQSQRVFLNYQAVSIQFSVTPTTIQDEYNITLQATFNTTVPAPLLLLEPLSINLPDMQAGEQVSGQLTLTNYGLIDAQDVQFTPPASDSFFDYVFQMNVPSVLPAKTQLTIPYTVTAKVPVSASMRKLMAHRQTPDPHTALGQFLLSLRDPAGASSCNSYANQAQVKCQWTCAAGDRATGGASALFSKLMGSSCSNPGIALGGSGGGGGGGGGGVGGFGGAGGGWSPAPIAQGRGCTPKTPCPCCGSGTGAGNK